MNFSVRMPDSGGYAHFLYAGEPRDAFGAALVALFRHVQAENEMCN